MTPFQSLEAQPGRVVVESPRFACEDGVVSLTVKAAGDESDDIGVPLLADPSGDGVVAYLPRGRDVTVTEKRTVDGNVWLRVPSGTAVRFRDAGVTEQKEDDAATSQGEVDADNEIVDNDELGQGTEFREADCEEDLWLAMLDETGTMVIERAVPFVETFEVELNGASGMAIAFHEDTNLSGADVVELFRNSTCNDEDRIGSALQNTDIAPESPLKIRTSLIYVRLTVHSAFSCSFRMVAAAAVIPRDPWEKYMVPGRHVLLESLHEYANDTNSFDDVQINEASSIAVIFDSRTSTETNYDYIKMLYSKNSDKFYGEEKYTGMQAKRYCVACF